MKVIKDAQVVEDDLLHLDDDQPTPAAGVFTVSFARWTAERDALIGLGRAGVRINGDDSWDAIVADLEHFATIAIEFPEFADGRGYSLARMLRDHHRYGGELRATGDILRDQVFYLTRCGFNVLEVRADKDVGDALQALRDFTVTYQPASDGRPPVYRSN